MAEQQIVPTPGGVVVSTAITAGGDQWQHAEGIVVTTHIGAGGFTANHAEGLIAAGRSRPGYCSGGTSAAGASA